MRSSSISKTVEAALNELFDANPDALSELLKGRVPLDTAVAKMELEVPNGARALRNDETIGLLDVVNAILGALAPGKQLSTIQGPDGLEGFVLARARKPKVDPVPLPDDAS